jgi:hypothetical protein
MQFLKAHERISSALEKNEVEFMIVNFYGYNRSTSDLDIWLKPSTDNFLKLIKAIESLQFDVTELKTLVFDQKNFHPSPF